MQKLKKPFLLLITVLLLWSSLSGFAQTAPMDVTVEGAIFGGSREQAVQTQIQFDPDWLTGGDNTRYNPELARFAALLSADIYFRDKDLSRGTQNRVLYPEETEYTHTALLERLGFSDVQYVESYKAGAYDTDTNDSATMLMAYANAADKYDTYIFVLRGCFSLQEWFSAFDPGADSAAYTALTGEHAEWTDTAVLKGYAIAANRALVFMSDYMSAHDDPARPDCILVTGHSRGGAIANIIGASLEESSDAVSFTYTFNAPGISALAIPGQHRTVFNVYEENDLFVSPLPFGAEPIFRFGRDITNADIDDTQLADAFSQLTGRPLPVCLTAEEHAEYSALFGSRFADRASLYEMRTLTRVFADEAEAAACRDSLLTLISAESGLGLEAYCTAGEVTPSAEGYAVTLHYCDAAWMVSCARLLAAGASVYDGICQLFEGDNDGCAVADFLANHLAAVSSGHLLARSYVIAGLAAAKK